MFSLSLLFTSFFIIFIAEIGDKTQLIAFSLTSTSKKPVVVFIASSGALIVSTFLAALLGKLMSDIIPSYTQYIAVALFIIFGFFIIFTKEIPRIKECFLEVVLWENEVVKLLPKLFKKNSMYNLNIINIIRQERSHADVFRYLVKKKTLFKDDINNDPRLIEIMENFKKRPNILKMSIQNAFKELIKKEKTGISFYSFLYQHLEADHHEEKEFQEMLKTLIQEEREHIKLFASYARIAQR